MFGEPTNLTDLVLIFGSSYPISGTKSGLPNALSLNSHLATLTNGSTERQTYNTKTDIVVAIRRGIIVATRTTAILGIIDPGTAAQQ